MDFSKVDKALDDILSFTKAPSLSYGIIHQGKILRTGSKGLRDVESGLLANKDTLYAIGSLSKAFTAALCGILVSEGVITWRSPISGIFPDFNPTGNPHLAPHANLIDFLSHATGLDDLGALYFGVDGTSIADQSNVLQIVNSLTTTPDKSFRKEWKYNNIVYGLLGHILETILEKSIMETDKPRMRVSFEELLRCKIFEPLGMTKTRMTDAHLDSELGQNIAVPYVVLENGEAERTDFSHYDQESCLQPSLGIMSSINDMLKYAGALLEALGDEKSPDTSKLGAFEADTIFRSTFPFKGMNGQTENYCLGWVRSDIIEATMLGASSLTGIRNFDIRRPVANFSGTSQWNQSQSTYSYNHIGTVLGYDSAIQLFPETQSAIVVLANGIGRATASNLASQVLAPWIFGRPIPDHVMRFAEYEATLEIEHFDRLRRDWSAKRDHNPAKSASSHIGIYINEDSEIQITITTDTDDDGATVSFHKDGTHAMKLEHYSEDSFTFFPESRDEYTRRGMSHFNHWRHFLLTFYIDEETGETAGLWWQPNATHDALWFSTADTDSEIQEE